MQRLEKECGSWNVLRNGLQKGIDWQFTTEDARIKLKRLYWCGHCQKFHYAPMPAHIEKGQLIGPRITAIVAYLKGACHCLFSTIRKFLRDVVGVTISRGQLSKLIQKASAAFEQSYNELLE